ncbi:hypothetical protein A9Q84_13045 [Halobacteriovorax marinus]|mgnify:CR=1 FL=1|uniref:Response regulatory domain-containing protein n=1 Tax=Halobacteriovorax marinus TaxID=97084 RepID=A0A1Y5F8J6_9BACT|nr:hypothetical protein A9Q84_13045 [Halobacteriovorax marinus]
MGGTLAKQSLKILLVDDDMGIVDVIQASLEDAGHSVVVANDGVEASLKLKNQNFDFLITDLNLPKKDGVKLVNELMGVVKIPILMITGELSNFEIRLKNLKNVMLLPKPFNPVIVPVLVNKIFKSFSIEREKARVKKLMTA